MLPRPQVADTIGAGDYFTAGFLYAWLGGHGLQRAAACGCVAGAEAVQATGAELTPAAKARLRAGIAAALDGSVPDSPPSRVGAAPNRLQAALGPVLGSPLLVAAITAAAALTARWVTTRK